ncbi:PA3496 family putative envelope integrity protein [Legionella tunisiensis]|uniref:PA3496 family putative envelope integrity protein n=1 Tax=Legionella tunisiensis TaxID=1034944 RepID=UPI0002F68C0D|nr:hypothetical protein [Legionella tunisiensis]
MSTQRFDDLEIGLEENINSTEMSTETNLSTKLERRRRIEDLFEQKRLREEWSEFDLA